MADANPALKLSPKGNIARALAIDILCPSPDHPVNTCVEQWAGEKGANIVRSLDELGTGDFLFLISCGEFVTAEMRAGYRHVLVIHASDLPSGRGWSPHVWAILGGTSRITVSLLSAEEKIDSGAIWHKIAFELDGTELCDEINARLFAVELDLMSWALANCDRCTPVAQVGEASWWPRRTPECSRIEPGQTVAEIFDLLRVCDPERFPAFMDYRGARYAVGLRRMK